MCSVGDDNVEEEGSSKFMEKSIKLNIKNSVCNKCREQKGIIVLRSKDVYCKNCFLAGTTHKFKAFLGKHRFVYPNDKVLILHETGHPSTALLHFLRAGLDLSTPKKLKFEPIILYIEDRYDLSVTERLKLLRSVKEEVDRFNFPLYFINLIDYINTEKSIKDFLCNDLNDLQLSDSNKEELNSYFIAKSNITVKNDTVNLLRRNLLIEAAKALSCSCVFITDLAIDLASHLLTSISLGRGDHISLDVGVCDDRDSDVKIVRPLRMFDIKELAYYNHYHNLSPVTSIPKKTNTYESVQSLMKKFVEDLQVNYPATITTVVKTGDKLAMNKNIVDNEKCEMCKGPKNIHFEELSSAESTRFSHWVSTQTPDSSLAAIERYNQMFESFQNQCDTRYCFGCSQLKKFCNKNI